MSSPDALRLPVEAFPITLVVNPARPDLDENMEPIGSLNHTVIFLEVRLFLRGRPVKLQDNTSPFYGPMGPWRFDAAPRDGVALAGEGLVLNSLVFGPEGAQYFPRAEGAPVRYVAVEAPLMHDVLLAAVEHWLDDILPSTADFAAYEQTKADELEERKVEAIAQRAEQLEDLEALESHAKQLLISALDAADIKYHSPVTSRVKSQPSILDKLERHKDDYYTFGSLGDLVGVRVVCLFLDDLELVAAVIRKTFLLRSVENKVAGSAVDAFGYMSVHHNVQLRWNEETPAALQGRSLEIQVRTVLMDAWANVSHFLDYNTDRRIPGALRRDFHALSGSLYTADLQFQTLFRKVKEAERKALALDSADALLDVDTLGPYLAKKFPDRVPCGPNEVAEMTELLFRVGCDVVGDVERLLERTERAAAYYEREHPPPNSVEYGEPITPGRYSAAGILRASIEVAFPRPVRAAVSSSMPYWHLVDPAS